MIQLLKIAVIILLGQATTKTFQARMTVNETYKPGYSNSDSAEFKTFATHFSQTVGKFLSKKLVGFKRCEVKKLASGSVIVVAYIVVDPVQTRSRSDVTADLIAQLLWDASYDTELEYTFLGHLSVSATDQ